jgi:hypothetical protein
MKVAMWTPDSQLTGVTSRKGEKMYDKAPADFPIYQAAPDNRTGNGLYSLAIALLPFFKPNKAVRDRLDKHDILTGASAITEYFELIADHVVFSVLAHYVVTTKFKLNARLQKHVEGLAKKFGKRTEPVEMAHSSAVSDLESALAKFRPSIKRQGDDDDFVQIESNKAAYFAKELLNVALVNVAKQNSTVYKVYSHPSKS